MENSPITIQVTVSIPKAKAWDVYTQPEHITRWNFASPDWHCPFASNDLREGGKYLARMEAKDGSFGFDFEGIYTAINAPDSLSYTMPDDRVVTVVFEEKYDQTCVTVTFDPEMENPLDLQRAGWQAILDNFKVVADQVS